MFESIATLVTFQPSPRSNSKAEKSYYPIPINSSTMSNQANYNVPASPDTPRNQRRQSSFPTIASPPSISQQSYSAARTPSVSSASSSGQAQGMLSKMASNSPPGSRLMTPAMTPFPSPAEEGAPYASAAYSANGLGMNPATSDGRRPGMERSQHGYISFPDFEQFRQSFEQCNMSDTASDQQQRS